MKTRRRFLLAAGGVVAGFPAIVRAESGRPRLEHGVQSGDVTGGRAIVWSRADRPARLVVEWDTTDTFREPRRIVGPAALEDTGLTARVALTDLPAGQRIFYRARFQDLGDLRTWSEPETGSFATASTGRDQVRLAWGADTAGQGWGIDTARGGMTMYETMRRAEPHLFVHVGDTIYADNPLKAEVTLDDGSIWRNLVTPAKSKVAETLDELRGNHLYNLLDDNVRRFAAAVTQVHLWDDHEVVNNWYPAEILDDPRYAVKSAALLAARAKRAFLEHYPIGPCADDPERLYRKIGYGPSLDVFVLDLRTYRGDNSANRQAERGEAAAILGRPQLEWLQRGLRTSTATWKVVACDMPLGLVVEDGPHAYEAVSNGDPGPPLGRELEVADILAFLKRERVRNVVWITGDVHYAAAHHYAPERARFKDFDPFWEFVAGPLHAGTFAAKPLDATFGPEVRFLGTPADMKPNRPPSEGLQFFGTMTIGRDQVMTVRLHDATGRAVFELPLEPVRA
jgi:alkaline phosphatase D